MKSMPWSCDADDVVKRGRVTISRQDKFLLVVKACRLRAAVAAVKQMMAAFGTASPDQKGDINPLFFDRNFGRINTVFSLGL